MAELELPCTRFSFTLPRAIKFAKKMTLCCPCGLTVKCAKQVELFWQQGFESRHIQLFLSLQLFHNTEEMSKLVSGLTNVPIISWIMRSYWNTWNTCNLLIIGKCGIP